MPRHVRFLFSAGMLATITFHTISGRSTRPTLWRSFLRKSKSRHYHPTVLFLFTEVWFITVSGTGWKGCKIEATWSWTEEINKIGSGVPRRIARLLWTTGTVSYFLYGAVSELKSFCFFFGCCSGTVYWAREDVNAIAHPMVSMVVACSAVAEAIKREYDMLKKNVNVNLCGVVMLNVKCVITDVKNIFVIEDEELIRKWW